MRTALLALLCCLLTAPALADDSTYIRDTALSECIAAHDAVMADPENRSEITPDVHRWRASLAYAREVDARANAIVLIDHPVIAQTISPPPVGAVEPAPPTIPVITVKPSDKLHDPLSQPVAAFDDLKAAKKQGWAAAILCAVIMLTTAFARASQTWPNSKLLSWFAKKKTAIFVVSGIGTVSAAAFNVLALGGQWTAVMWAAAGAALALIAPKHEPKAAA